MADALKFLRWLLDEGVHAIPWVLVGALAWAFWWALRRLIRALETSGTGQEGAAAAIESMEATHSAALSRQAAKIQTLERALDDLAAISRETRRDTEWIRRRLDQGST